MPVVSALRVCLGHKDPKVTLARREQKVTLARRDHKDPKVTLARREQKVTLALRDHKDPKVTLEPVSSWLLMGTLTLRKKKLLNLETLPDAKVDDSLAITRKDFYSAVNKGYVNENFLKKDGFNFDLKGSNITNGEPYYDGLYGDRDLVCKKYVDLQDAKQDIAINDKLSKDGTSKMEGALDMNNNKIVNVGDTTEQDGDAINYRYFNREKGVLTGLIKQAVQRDGSVPMTGDLNMDSNKISNLNTDDSDLDSAANVRYVSTSTQNWSFRFHRALTKR